MLAELRIRNFAIIEEAALEFCPGLNILSGETGAGKTIILSALGLLLGGRASPDVIRTDAKEAVVEALFELEGEFALEGLASRPPDRGELVIRRIIAEGGRSRVLIDSELATVQTLSRVGPALVQVYGQHEAQSLLRPESHETLLDRFARVEDLLAQYREFHQLAQSRKTHLEDLTRRERERADLLDLARFRVTELEKAELIAGEDGNLHKERLVLANAAKLSAAAHESEEMLYGAEGAALDIIAKAEARLVEAAEIDPALAQTLETLRTSRANLEETAHSLRTYTDRIEADPARLEEIDARLQELLRLKRKYGGSLDEAIVTLEKSRAEIAELENVAVSKHQAEVQLDRALDDLLAAAKKLSAERKRGAIELKRKMEAELKTLGMRAPVFEANFARVASGEGAMARDGIAMGPTGIDVVEFYLSPNLGQPPMPLARIASGGELSRVMLALKRLEAQRRGVATMIFDEVDAGIGGEIAQVVGRKLKELAKYHQILCVTHLPQIAAFADRHFHLEKEERRGATRSIVRQLEQAERADEIARMLGGAEISDKFRRAARELLTRAS
ncbi:MAG TPA: DNA repair protein RecN [Candidatus Binatus sp.]|nr:DNA repair protein RecN [Candidatus Binatus sp.]